MRIKIGKRVSAVGLSVLAVATSFTLLSILKNHQAEAVLPAPGGVEGAALWLKADQGVQANGSNQVEQWNDQSGAGLVTTEARAALNDHTTAITATNNITRVANGLNFNPAVDFAGVTNRSLKGSTSASWNSVADLNVFGVSSTEGQSPGNLSGIFTTNGGWTSNAVVGRGLLASKNGDAYMLDGAGCSPGLTTASARPHIGRGVYVATNTTTGGSTWLDGTKAVDTGHCAQGTGGANFEIGGRTGDTGYENRIYNGKIPEVIVYKSTLTTQQAQQVDSYLGIKYGITLGSNTLDYLASDGATKAWDAVANSGYYNNVFGIGRDDASALNQKQSKSVNPGAIVTIGNGNTIAADNAANSNNFGADKTFMMVGDNGAPVSASGLLSGTATNQVRMARAWKVDETNTVGSVKVRVPGSSVPGLSPVLVRSTDDTFTASDTLVPLSSDGNGNFEADYNFGDGDYFTFAYVGAAPGGVFGMTAWQKANAGTPSGASWSDSSGSGNTATQTVAGNQPAFVTNGINFNPSLDFNGVAKYYNYATDLGINGLADFSSIAVSSHRDLSDRPIILGSVPAANQYHLQFDIDGNPWVGMGGGGGGCSITNSTAVLPLNTPGISSAVRGSSTMAVRLDANASNQGSGTCNSTQFNAPRTLGGRPGSSYVDGLIPEYVQYPRALTDTELQKVDSYLAVKYGITLPTVNYVDSNEAVLWGRTANAAYNNNITGIGRDDLSALNQKQSKSVNPQGIVTVGNNTIAADNASNGNNFSADKSFLMFGDDNNSATAWTSTGVTNTTLTNYQRLARTWKVQETGTVGDVTLRLDTADLDADVPAAISNYYLLRDSNNNGSFADETPILMTDAGGGQFSASGIDFMSGETFTFATLSNTYSVQIQVVDNLTGENGDTGSFKVCLGARPSAAVTIALSSSNTNEGTVPTSITIQPDDWNNCNANIVTVTGVNDSPPVGDGSVPYTIVTGEVASTDPNFDALVGTDVADVAMENQNDDPPGVAVTVVDNTSGEDGSTARVRFALLSAPSADVTIPLSLSDTSEGSLGAVTSITITPANWNQPQNNEVVITGVDDALTDGDVLYQLVTGDPSSGDSGYGALVQTDVADATLANADNDSPGVTVSQTDGSTSVTEGGATDIFSVVLNTQPAPGNTVVINVQPDGQVDLGGGAGSAIQLTFDNSNWNQPQTVTVTANDDSVIEGGHSGSIALSIDGSTTEAEYTTVNPADVAVQITDNDDDDDGVAAEVESACPNNGDSNDDGIKDSLQRHVTCFPSPVTDKYVGLEVDSTCQLNAAGVAAEVAQTAADPGYEYPYGLMNFTADCGTPGYTTTVRQYYFGTGGDNLVLRKHNPAAKTYFTVSGSTIDRLAIGGEPLVRATFQVKDGSELDMDGDANGKIVDPAGLAVAAPPADSSSSGSGSTSDLADTGSNILLAVTGAGALAATGVVIARRQRRTSGN